MSDFNVERPITATRKDHKCFECQATIPVGSACVAWSGLYMGVFNGGWSHADCGKAARHYRLECDLGGEEWYGLREDYCGHGEAGAIREALADWPDVIERVLRR